MASIMDMVGKRSSREADFIGSKVTIYKLSVGEVKRIQEIAREQEALSEDEQDELAVVSVVIKSSVEGGADLQREHFEAWPMDEIRKLSTAIMRFSGFDAGAEGKQD
jgi:hypothetical protein